MEIPTHNFVLAAYCIADIWLCIATVGFILYINHKAATYKDE